MGIAELVFTFLQSETFHDIGIFGIASGAFVWLFKSIYKQTLDKEMEKFKHELSIKHLQFSKLYETRAKVTMETYRLLNKFDDQMGSLTSPMQWTGDLSKKAKAKKAITAGNSFAQYYRENKIYFSKQTGDLLDEINKEFHTAWNLFTTLPLQDEQNRHEPRETAQIRHESWSSAWRTMKEKVPPLRGRLETDFRQILGIEDNQKTKE